MAWSAVASAVTTIGKLVAAEASYLWGVEEQVDRLLTDLKWMQNFLTNEEGRQAADGIFHLHAAEIRDLAYDAEDVVETFALKIVSKRKPGCTNCIKRAASILHEGWMLQQTRSEIDKIIAKSNDLVRRLQAFQPNTSRGGGGGEASSSLTDMKEKRRPFPHIVDKNTVGLDDDFEKLIAILDDEESEYRVVSICGTGGLGKTTLAKKIYQHEEFAGNFQHVAFVYVSQLYERGKVWKEILTKLTPKERDSKQSVDRLGKEQVWEDISKLTSIAERGSEQSVDQLAADLFKFLEENKYLVILDDIWSAKAWNDLKPAFSLRGSSKSKILLTSRCKMTVSDADGRGYVYELPPLTEEESWELIEKITSPPNDSPDYRKLGMKIIQRCPKLPLAIVALGGILAKKKNSLTGWNKVAANVEVYLKDDKELKLEKVLALSYDDLPYHLKSCFLYLSHFPEDYQIETQRLIQLLVAEGIVLTEKKGEIAEDVAEGYVMELAERFMIQPRETDPATLKITTFQLHDEMRLLCLSKAEQENFVFIVNESNPCSLSTIPKVRRISAYKPFEAQLIECPNLRSLTFFNTRFLGELFEVQTPSACITGPFSGRSCFWYESAAYIRFLKARGFWVHIFTNLKLLRVLNFEGGLGAQAECKLIGDIGNLIHLRFLSLRSLSFQGSKLPSSLGNLICLQTLDLRVGGRGPIHVPDVIWRMEQLRHLYLPLCCTNNTKLKLDTLTNLLTLVNFNTENYYLTDLIHMTHLVELDIYGPFKIEDENLPIIHSNYLHTLSIGHLLQRIDQRHLTNLFSCCVSISKLILHVGISKLPELRYLPPSLTYMSLRRCNLEKDPLPTLEQLPNLRVLELHYEAFLGEKMLCSAQGFPKLESLRLMHLDRLEQWKVDERAMPCLRQLKIRGCYRLDMRPVRLRFKAILKE